MLEQQKHCPNTLPIEFPQQAISAFCQRNHIHELALFGSVLRDDFGPESDVDVLVEFVHGSGDCHCLRVGGWRNRFSGSDSYLLLVVG